MTAPNSVIKYVSMAFAVVYIGIGIAVLWKSNELTNFPDGYAIPFGILFILYGLFRGYRVFQRYY